MPKAIRFHSFGGPEVLKFEDMPARQPGPGEVAMKVSAVGLNRAESMYFHGHYMETPKLPSGLGYEAVGTITAVGQDVDASLVGKRFGTIPGYSMNNYPVLVEEAVVPGQCAGGSSSSALGCRGRSRLDAVQHCLWRAGLLRQGKDGRLRHHHCGKLVGGARRHPDRESRGW